ncbi:transmembrane protein 255B-like isoform X3 [Petromyzon marinus]|uniref:transmembrane protein 255B-like isoform X3 n=1 Tax=Petromyzon marinus TaxID=7757 RepID=UPI003F708C4A
MDACVSVWDEREEEWGCLRMNRASHLTPPPPPGVYQRRKKAALGFTSALLTLAAAILVTGLVGTTRTDNVAVVGFYAGIVLGFGAFLGLLGVSLVENRRQMDPRPLYAERCQFYTSGDGYIYENYFSDVPCRSSHGDCSLKIRSGTCYCCDLYNCGSGDYAAVYYEFVGVRSCLGAVHLYRLLWLSTLLNVCAVFLGIVTSAVLGSFKDTAQTLPRVEYVPSSLAQISYSPSMQSLSYSPCYPGLAPYPYAAQCRDTALDYYAAVGTGGAALATGGLPRGDAGGQLYPGAGGLYPPPRPSAPPLHVSHARAPSFEKPVPYAP